jgi:RNA polymerase sigma-70 factor (ECF subfamily)
LATAPPSGFSTLAIPAWSTESFARVPHSDVDDLVQDVFLSLASPHLSELSRFPGWLASIARNRAIDFHRRAKPTDEFDEESNSTQSNTPAHSANHSSHSSAGARAVLEAIRSLPDAYREPLILRLVEGMTGPEIAARTGLTHGSVRVNLHRGMQQLREILGRKALPPRGCAMTKNPTDPENEK